VALEFALARPERVAGLVLISPAVYTNGPPSFVRLLWSLPQLQRLGPRLLRELLPRFGPRGITAAWHDPSQVSDEVRAGYGLPLRARNWDQALWSFSRAARFDPLEPRLEHLQAPVLVITGDDDRIVPTAESVRLAEALSARLLVIERCGHLAHEECPAPVLYEIADFIEVGIVDLVAKESLQ
jgi:pimeloyl-ACP methyl ester carboxylesterase